NNENKKSTQAEIRAELLKNSEFATLRDAKGLNSILAMGIDSLAGVRWLKSMQGTLCPNGGEVKYDEYGYRIHSRPDYLLKDGICINDDQDFEKVLNSLELALNGGLYNATFKASNYGMEDS